MARTGSLACLQARRLQFDYSNQLLRILFSPPEEECSADMFQQIRCVTLVWSGVVNTWTTTQLSVVGAVSKHVDGLEGHVLVEFAVEGERGVGILTAGAPFRITFHDGHGELIYDSSN